MRKLERLKCSSCQSRLGKKGGEGHIHYPSPLICHQCGTDNTANLKPHLIEPQEPQGEPQQPQPQPQPQPQNASAEQPQQPQSDRQDYAQATPLLDNERHEAFCRGIAIKKLTATRAYLAAGYETSYSAARSSATALLANPNIGKRVEELRAEVAARTVTEGLLERQERIYRLERRAAKLDEVIASRASDPEMLDVPGGQTGLLVKTWKAAGAQIVEEFSVDTGLLKELRAVEQQAAQEMGEWLNKTAVDLRSDIPMMDVPADASIEQIRAAKAKMLEAMAAFKTVTPPPPDQSVQ